MYTVSNATNWIAEGGDASHAGFDGRGRIAPGVSRRSERVGDAAKLLARSRIAQPIQIGLAVTTRKSVNRLGSALFDRRCRCNATIDVLLIVRDQAIVLAVHER